MNWKLTLAVAASSAIGFAAPALAGPGMTAQGPVMMVPDDPKKGPNIDELARQFEKSIVDVVEWDATAKRYKLKADIAKGLPVPAPMVEGFLNRLLKNVDGRPVLKDKEAFRQMLPMLKRFMKKNKGSLERFGKATPEQRQKMLKKARGYGKMLRNPKARKGLKKLGELGRKGFKARPSTPRRPTAARPSRNALERRVGELERRIVELEKALGGKRSSPRFARRGPAGDILGGIGDVARAVRKFTSLLKAGDRDRFKRLFSKLTKDFDPSMLRDQGALLQKLQSAVNPQDLERFMEIFSEFMESEEGQAIEARIEKTVSRFEEFMNTERGKKLEEGLSKLQERIQKQLKGNSGGGGGFKQLRKLLGKRSPRKTGKRRARRGSKRRHQQATTELY